MKSQISPRRESSPRQAQFSRREVWVKEASKGSFLFGPRNLLTIQTTRRHNWLDGKHDGEGLADVTPNRAAEYTVTPKIRNALLIQRQY